MAKFLGLGKSNSVSSYLYLGEVRFFGQAESFDEVPMEGRFTAGVLQAGRWAGFDVANQLQYLPNVFDTHLVGFAGHSRVGKAKRAA